MTLCVTRGRTVTSCQLRCLLVTVGRQSAAMEPRAGVADFLESSMPTDSEFEADDSTTSLEALMQGHTKSCFSIVW